MKKRFLHLLGFKTQEEYLKSIFVMSNLILEHGGKMVDAATEDESLNITNCGVYMSPDNVTELNMTSSDPHGNCAKVNTGDIYTGYARKGDKWVSHSWLVDGDCIIETTTKKDGYFGFKLNEKERANFVENQV